MKTNISDYFANYPKLIKRMDKARQFIESVNGDLTKCSLYDIILMSGNGMFSPQKRTSFIEDKMREQFSWTSVSSRKDRGDYIDSNGKYFELKCSSSNDNNTLNILQIRPWQPVDYYRIIYFDLDCPTNSKAYYLSKDDMLKEIKDLGSSACHGTKKANKGNTFIEYSIHLPIDNHWDKLYLDKNFFING